MYGYTTKSEPILSQTPDFEKSRAKRGLNTPTAPRPAKRGAGKTRKNFPINFLGRAQFLFSIRSENFCGIASPPFGGGGAVFQFRSGAAGIPFPPTPFPARRACPPLAGPRGRRRGIFWRQHRINVTFL